MSVNGLFDWEDLESLKLSSNCKLEKIISMLLLTVGIRLTCFLLLSVDLFHR